MEQPLTLRWQSPEHYYTAMLTPDLFGGWMLVTASGSRSNGGGRVHQKPVENYDQGLDAIRQLRHRRRREGYDLCGSAFTEFQGLDPNGADLRGAETNALLRIFDVWGVTERAHQSALLGVDDKALGQYLDGRPLANEPELLTRAGHLLAIHKVLRLRYANRRPVIREWLGLTCAILDGRTPMEVMLASPEGLANLRRHLEQEADSFRSCVRD